MTVESDPSPAGLGDRLLQIVRGDPTAEELAAVIALLTAASDGPAPGSPDPLVRGRWNDPARLVRRGWAPGPGGWRSAR